MQGQPVSWPKNSSQSQSASGVAAGVAASVAAGVAAGRKSDFSCDDITRGGPEDDLQVALAASLREMRDKRDVDIDEDDEDDALDDENRGKLEEILVSDCSSGCVCKKCADRV